jgi:cell division protein FtsZ
MFEIQDAAKVITESIDPNAKVIFGTVRDDKLKKNEVKVTVIAAGFPEQSISSASNRVGGLNRSTSSFQANTESVGASVLREEKKLKPTGEQNAPIAAQQPAPVAPAKKEEKKDEDDDWGAVPAFLRRSKIK